MSWKFGQISPVTFVRNSARWFFRKLPKKFFADKFAKISKFWGWHVIFISDCGPEKKYAETNIWRKKVVQKSFFLEKGGWAAPRGGDIFRNFFYVSSFPGWEIHFWRFCWNRFVTTRDIANWIFVKIIPILGGLPHGGYEQFCQNRSKLSNPVTPWMRPENLVKFRRQVLSATRPDGFPENWRNIFLRARLRKFRNLKDGTRFSFRITVLEKNMPRRISKKLDGISPRVGTFDGLAPAVTLPHSHSFLH